MSDANALPSPWGGATRSASQVMTGCRVIDADGNVIGTLRHHGSAQVPRFDEFDPDEWFDVYAVLPLL